MSQSSDPRPELANTYVVQDRSNLDELTRLQIQDQLITARMGGVLPEQTNVETMQKVLDVACGTGDWLLATAKAYPSMSLLVGAEISSKMVEHARNQAEIRQLSGRVEFHVMDALRMLEFPSNFFDLVNMRFGISFIRAWEWPKLLQEFQRVTRSQGTVRITEVGDNLHYNGEALSLLRDLLTESLAKAGHTFISSDHGNPDELVPLFERHGLLNVQRREHEIIFRGGTPEGENFSENITKAYRTLLPFFQKWVRVPANYEEIYQQALQEMKQPDFTATWRVITVWGTVPSKRS